MLLPATSCDLFRPIELLNLCMFTGTRVSCVESNCTSGPSKQTT